MGSLCTVFAAILKKSFFYLESNAVYDVFGCYLAWVKYRYLRLWDLRTVNSSAVHNYIQGLCKQSFVLFWDPTITLRQRQNQYRYRYRYSSYFFLFMGNIPVRTGTRNFCSIHLRPQKFRRFIFTTYRYPVRLLNCIADSNIFDADPDQRAVEPHCFWSGLGPWFSGCSCWCDIFHNIFFILF